MWNLKTHRPVNNGIKTICAHNTKVKEVKGSLEVFFEYYFEFATKDMLQEQLEKDIQCSGMFIVVIKTSNKLIFLTVM